VYLVPAFSGLGLPHWQPAARAAIVGLTTHSDRRHVLRAALESIAYQLRDALAALAAEAGVAVAEIRCDGGPTANGFLMQFTADLTGVTLHVAPTAECSARGAALAGLLGLGVHASLAELAQLGQNGRAFNPSMASADVARLARGWRHAVNQAVLPGAPQS
jgi:glycerol kinase